MAKILQIGTVDVSNYVLRGQSVKTAAVYDSHSFTNVLGITKRKRIGNSISVSASFGDVPEDVADALTAACTSGDVEVIYRDTSEKTLTFEQPSIQKSIDFEDADGNIYRDITVDMTCPLADYSL